MYGCHNLQRGDRDSSPTNSLPQIWGGVSRAPNSICPNIPSNPIGSGTPTPVNVPQHVHQLQVDLRTLGFLLVGIPSGLFDLNTDRAVREFQIYAKMRTVARIRANAPANTRQSSHIVAQLGQLPAPGNLSVYVDSLEQTPNTSIYTSAVSGVVNADTRVALQHWLDNDYRCPVIVEAWTVSRGNRSNIHQLNGLFGVNIWLHDEWPNSGPRFFVRDFTGYYALPPAVVASDMMVIGDFQPLPEDPSFTGPRSVPPSHTLPHGEMLRETLVGQAVLNASQASTFRVVRACAEVECIGFFDCVNCFDNAFVSVGPCHWTLGIATGRGNDRPVSEGELPGYLAYLRNVDSLAFQALFEFFGASVEEDWNSATRINDGSDLFIASQRKYSGCMQLQTENRLFLRLPMLELEWNYFKNWHWHYRFVSAGRTTDPLMQGYQRRMWDMARMRLRDIRSVPWGSGVANITSGTGGARLATIGDVITSEKAMALVLRWHIRFPNHIASANTGTGANAGQRLRNILALATNAQPTLAWTGSPSLWTNAHEAALIQGILDEASNLNNQNLIDTLNYVDSWPNWVGRSNPNGFRLANPGNLNVNRNSFDFDSAQLPPSP